MTKGVSETTVRETLCDLDPKPREETQKTRKARTHHHPVGKKERKDTTMLKPPKYKKTRKQKRTVGPAFATINTVSPLGTALTVPRSHPVTGILRVCVCGALTFAFFKVFFCADTKEKTYYE